MAQRLAALALAGYTAHEFAVGRLLKVVPCQRLAISIGRLGVLVDANGIVADGRMGLALAMISAGMGEQITVPVESDSYWVGGQQAVKWDTPKALELFAGIGG